MPPRCALVAVADAWRWGAVDRATLEGSRRCRRRGRVDRGAGVPERIRQLRPPERARSRQPGLEGLVGRHHVRRRHAADPPIALVEVQGYTYAALLAAADLAAELPDAGLDPGDLRRAHVDLRDRFNERYWDPRGWFALGLDGSGRPIDALTTNPGHALWCGIAEAVTRRSVPRPAARAGPVVGLGTAHAGQVNGRVRPAELPQRLRLAARHSDLRRWCRPLREVGCGRPPRGRRTRRCRPGSPAARPSCSPA